MIVTVTRQDSADFAELREARQDTQNAVTDAGNAARAVLQAAGFKVSYDDRHACLDAAIWCYLRDSNEGVL